MNTGFKTIALLIGMIAAVALSRLRGRRRRRDEWRGFTSREAAGRPRVVIVGAGFGGLRAARSLAEAPVQVLLIDRQNYHSFSPLLYQVATAALEPDAIARPVRAILRDQENFSFQMETVTGIDTNARVVETSTGPISYDYLVLAPGSMTNFFGMQSVQERAFGLKDLDDAIRLRSRLLGCFERAATEPDPDRKAALLTFVVVGGGPTGVELAGAMAELIEHVLARDYPDIDVSRSRVLLLEAANVLLTGFDPDLQQEALHALQEKGVTVDFGAAVQGLTGGTVLLRDGREIPAETVIWTAGVRAADLVTKLGAPTGRSGRVNVQPTLQVPGHEEVYVIGDAAGIEQDGSLLPMIAPVAIQQGETAARNVARQLRGEAALPFRYRDKGMMVTIGRARAVAQVWGLRFKGFVAWALWLTVHVILLIGFRNRLVVLTNWAWDYFFRERAIRLITEPDTAPAPTDAKLQ